MQLTVYHRAGATADVPDVEVTWRHTTALGVGSLAAAILRDTPLWDQELLNPDGNFMVEAWDATLGSWRGVAQSLNEVTGGVRLFAVEQSDYANQRMVGHNRTFRGCTAGALARQGFMDAMAGLGNGPWSLGTFVEAGPLIPELAFNSQSFGSLLADLMARTGQEWSVTIDGVFSWRPPTGNVYPTVLAEGGDISNVERQSNLTERVSEVIAYGLNNRSARATLTDPLSIGYWQTQAAIPVDTTSDVHLALQAWRLLRDRRYPAVTYTGTLDPTHWGGVREGDWVTLLLPHLGIVGETVTCRVLSRTYRAREARLDLEMALQRSFSPSDSVRLGAESTEAGGFVANLRDQNRQFQVLASGVRQAQAQSAVVVQQQATIEYQQAAIGELTERLQIVERDVGRQ